MARHDWCQIRNHPAPAAPDVCRGDQDSFLPGSASPFPIKHVQERLHFSGMLRSLVAVGIQCITAAGPVWLGSCFDIRHS